MPLDDSGNPTNRTHRHKVRDIQKKLILYLEAFGNPICIS